MAEQERLASHWGPIADPPPWGWGGRGGGWRIPRWPDWGPEIDPAPLRDKLAELITPEDVAALQHARLEAHVAQLKAQVQLIEKEMEILGKYGQIG
jgi:hypothetical protein